jgi:acetyl-CoA carboxylase biotin carboxyl carrier protein
MALNDEDVREILRIIDESPLDELLIETEGFVLHVLRGRPTGDTTVLPPGKTRGGQSVVSPVAPVGRDRTVDEAPGPETPSPVVPVGPDPTVDEAPGPETSSPPSDGTVTIGAPVLGTFYRAEGPGQNPFVEVGSRVEPDTTVCIIEVMKMMNSVPAGVAGTIVQVCPQNAALVEYGEPLFRVEPAG